MELIKYIVLGIVQGFTEQLPISSSGHLALIEHWWRTLNPLQMAIFLHFGSFVAILFAFRHDIGAACRSFTSVIHKSTVFPSKYILSFREDSRRKIPFLIILSLLFTSIIAFPLKKTVESLFDDPSKVGLMLILNGIILVLAFWRSKYGSKSMTDIGIWECCVIGVAQGIAVLPGISRLGLTFVAALLWRMKSVEAAKYSFLLAAPTIFAANLFELIDNLRHGDLSSINALGIILGVVFAFIASYFAIRLFLGIVSRRKALLGLAGYCSLFGTIIIVVYS